MELFNIEPNKRVLSFYVMTYPANRIASKFMKLLKRGGVYKVRDEWDTTNIAADRAYIVSIESNEPYEKVVKNLRNEIISYISDHFPSNYFFDFEGVPLGFVNSFEIYGDHGEAFRVAHRIKEIRKDGTSKLRN